MSARDRLSALHHDLLLSIATYCSTTDILRLTESCLNTRNLIHDTYADKLIWKPLIDLLFIQKEYNIPIGNLIERLDNPVIFEYTMHTIYNLPFNKSLHSTSFMTYYTTIGKYQPNQSNIIQYMLLFALFYPTMHRIPTSTESSWISKLPPWKITYFYSILENKRVKLSMYELINISWSFKFKAAPLEHFSTRFNEDFTMVSEFHDESFNWKVCLHF